MSRSESIVLSRPILFASAFSCISFVCYVITWGLMGYYMTCLNAYLGYYVVFSMPALAYFYAILCYCSHEKTPVGGDNVVCVRVG